MLHEGGQMRAVILMLLVAGCASDALPPIPPRADLCVLYSSYRYSVAAASIEALDALDKHNANEEAYREKCLLGDRSKSLGPR